MINKFPTIEDFLGADIQQAMTFLRGLLGMLKLKYPHILEEEKEHLITFDNPELAKGFLFGYQQASAILKQNNDTSDDQLRMAMVGMANQIAAYDYFIANYEHPNTEPHTDSDQEC